MCIQADVTSTDEVCDAGLSVDDTDGTPQPEANGNADMDEEESHSNEEGIPSTVPHATAPQETPNLLDQPRYTRVLLFVKPRKQ